MTAEMQIWIMFFDLVQAAMLFFIAWVVAKIYVEQEPPR